MDKNDLIENIRKAAEDLEKNIPIKNPKAYIVRPTSGGMDVYEVDDEIAKHCIGAQMLRNSEYGRD